MVIERKRKKKKERKKKRKRKFCLSSFLINVYYTCIFVSAWTQMLSVLLPQSVVVCLCTIDWLHGSASTSVKGGEFGISGKWQRVPRA